MRYLWILMCFQFHAYSQGIKDSVLELKPIEVKGYKWKIGQHIKHFQQFDSIRSNETTASELLSQKSSFYFKTYSPGGSSTISLRGGSSSQTAVSWNGFNIQNPLIGQTDFSLIPVEFFEEIKVVTGPASSILDNGAMSGAVQFENNVKRDSSINVSATITAGSFGLLKQNAVAKVASDNSYLKLQILNVQCENDFKYLENENAEIKKQTHSAYSQRAFMAEGSVRKTRSVLTLRGWLQRADREIPPVLFQPSNFSTQQDKFLRLSAEYSYQLSNVTFHSRLGNFYEFINYFDSVASINSRSKARSFVLDNYSTFNYYGVSCTAGFLASLISGSTVGYLNQHQQNRYNAYLRLSKNFRRIKADLSVRREMISGFKIPLLYMGAVNFSLARDLSMFANISNGFRVPTLNDLYWVPGGNPDLKSETSDNVELGMKVNKVLGKFQFAGSSSVYSGKYNNMIVWLPGNGYWSPRNISSSWNRGSEFEFSLKFRSNKFIIVYKGSVNYCLSTFLEYQALETRGKQLLYSPLYSNLHSLHIQMKWITFRVYRQYFGYRYTTTDNYNYLSPYHLYNAEIISPLINGFQIIGAVNNITNQYYQVIENRTTALRNFSISIKYQFSKPLSNQNK